MNQAAPLRGAGRLCQRRGLSLGDQPGAHQAAR